MDQPCIMTANATILVGSLVMIDSSRNNAVIPCTSNAKAFGIAALGSRAAPIPDITDDPPIAALQGEELEVFTLGKFCLVRAGGPITPGADIKSGGSTGAAVVCAETTGLKEFSVGNAMEAASSGEYFKCLVAPRVLYTP
jgi:hypothetical protein